MKISPFGKSIVKLLALKQIYKDENIEVTKLLVKFLLNSFYGEQIRKAIEKKIACKSEYSMSSEYDERVEDYWKISHGNFIVEMVDDAGLEDEVKKLNTLPLHLVAFVLSNSKIIMNIFIDATNGFHTNDILYRVTDSVYTESKHRDKLDTAGLVGKALLHGRNDYKDGGIFYVPFLPPKKIV